MNGNKFWGNPFNVKENAVIKLRTIYVIFRRRFNSIESYIVILYMTQF